MKHLIFLFIILTGCSASIKENIKQPVYDIGVGSTYIAPNQRYNNLIPQSYAVKRRNKAIKTNNFKFTKE